MNILRPIGIILIIAFLAFSCKDKKVSEESSQPEQKKQEKIVDVKPDTLKTAKVEIEEEPKEVWPKMILVKKGEWIYQIARREYGDMRAWEKIYEANKDKISDPDLIYPDQELILP